ncbi:hypothetical protein G3580_01195 [Nitrogeniibacter mangrovi]|uniref:Lipoprotein n=1 Tax=Nitrogeniibacter mangrovi TaxID=2016596 RepID=A0A6C1AYC3_9RHOO|nr:hypothetical protein [Nitrogeniibacter mangrovi]QID16362.1 hypothetical protein G3580_01195 [Nitrogeniibacter mangrovi]
MIPAPRLARRALVALAAGLAACSSPLPPPAPPPEPVATPTPAPTPAPPVLRELPAAPLAKTPPAPPAPRAGRPTRAMKARPITLAMRCAAMDERKHTVQADVDVRRGTVRYLRARLAEPKGSCEFALPDFDQTKTLPSIELRARNGSGCVLRMWEQGPQVVLAYHGCEAYCEPGQAFAGMLPVLFDRRVGRCD